MSRDALNGNETETGRIEPRLLTSREVAALLQVSQRTLWRMLSAQRLPAPIRIGGVVRWRQQEVSDWIAEGCPERSA